MCASAFNGVLERKTKKKFETKEETQRWIFFFFERSRPDKEDNEKQVKSNLKMTTSEQQTRQ